MRGEEKERERERESSSVWVNKMVSYTLALISKIVDAPMTEVPQSLSAEKNRENTRKL